MMNIIKALGKRKKYVARVCINVCLHGFTYRLMCAQLIMICMCTKPKSKLKLFMLKSLGETMTTNSLLA